MFNHSEHTKLVKSCLDLLRKNDENVKIICPFTHYRPWLAEKDLQFIHRPEWDAAGFQWNKIAEERVPLMFENDRGDSLIRSLVFAYELIKKI